MKKEWLENITRDFVALGSPIFAILVVLRLLLIPNYDVITKIILASIIFIIPFIFLRQNVYSGIGFITLVFLMENYADFRFGVFAVITYVLLIGSLFYLKKEWKKILFGVLIGGVSAGISYYLVNNFFSF